MASGSRYCPACMRTYPEGIRFCSIDGRDLLEVDHDPLINEVIDGRYKVIRALGHGGMGRVYYAEHIKLNKPFALKFLLGDLTQNTEMIKRFSREAKSTSRLEHPNCVSVVDFGQTQNELLYLAMEYLEGQDLAKIMRNEGPLHPKRAAKIATQIAAGLGEAHRQGIIHRDLKPENIMLVRRGDDHDFVKILDFGLAKLLEQGNNEETGTALTSLGIVHGTPPYMSPEQANGDDLDGRSDLYSLGVILFQMVTGRLPFERSSAMEVMLAHVREKPPAPRSLRPDLPIAIEAMILQALEKNREKRFPDGRSMAHALQNAEDATEMLPKLAAHPGANPSDSRSPKKPHHQSGLLVPPQQATPQPRPAHLQNERPPTPGPFLASNSAPQGQNRNPESFPHNVAGGMQVEIKEESFGLSNSSDDMATATLFDHRRPDFGQPVKQEPLSLDNPIVETDQQTMQEDPSILETQTIMDPMTPVLPTESLKPPFPTILVGIIGFFSLLMLSLLLYFVLGG